MVIVPAKRCAFAVIKINSEDAGTLFAMREHLLDTWLGMSSPDWIAAYRQVFEQRNAKALQAVQVAAQPGRAAVGPSLPLAGYAGVYSDPWYGTITVSLDGSAKVKRGLRISFDRSPGMQGTLEHVQYDTFRTHWAMPEVEDAYVTFALDPAGQGRTRITMKAVSPLADFSYDYQDLRFEPASKQ